MDETTTTSDPTSSHRHTDRCWWDHDAAQWSCPPPARPETRTDPPVDIRDMVVVHTALLREFRMAPAAVTRVPLGQRRAAAAVDRHLGLLCDLLHHHHTGEDELLWPPLRDRLPARDTALLDGAEGEHAALDEGLRRVGGARRRWVEEVDARSRDALADALQTVHRLLAAHLDGEERDLLPLAAAYLTQGEWDAIGAAGAAGIPKSAMPLVFGMFAYEGDPAVVAGMLREAPAVPRLIIRLTHVRAYARRAAAVHGTARP